TPGPGDAIVKIAAAGVNYIDVYFRSGQYSAPRPLTLGVEAAGTVVEVAPDVTEVKVGDTAAWAGHPGAYAEYAAVPAQRRVGLLLCQIAKMRGARVIGTVSTEAKARLARDAGADDVILYTQQDFEAEVGRITGGKGCQVVYDSVGRTTFEKSLGCLALRGTL